jgi:hypothetical protein
MFEHEPVTRAAICGAGVLAGLVLLLAHLPPILLIVPVAILFLGTVADPEETHAVFYGMLSVLGIFDPAAITGTEKENYRVKRHYFWFGEVAMAAALAVTFAMPAGIFLAGKTETALAFTAASILFLALFVFLPKVIRKAMRADTGAVLEAFGKNEQVKKVFWAVFAGLAGLVMAQVLDPGTARQMVGIITGMGG